MGSNFSRIAHHNVSTPATPVSYQDESKASKYDSYDKASSYGEKTTTSSPLASPAESEKQKVLQTALNNRVKGLNWGNIYAIKDGTLNANIRSCQETARRHGLKMPSIQRYVRDGMGDWSMSHIYGSDLFNLTKQLKELATLSGVSLDLKDRLRLEANSAAEYGLVERAEAFLQCIAEF